MEKESLLAKICEANCTNCHSESLRVRTQKWT